MKLYKKVFEKSFIKLDLGKSLSYFIKKILDTFKNQ